MARCRILVVEDEAMIAMLVEEMVLDFGSEVVGPAAKMEEALRLASDASLDAATCFALGACRLSSRPAMGRASFHRVSEKTPRSRSRLAMKSLPGRFAGFLPTSPATPKQRKAASAADGAGSRAVSAGEAQSRTRGHGSHAIPSWSAS